MPNVPLSFYPCGMTNQPLPLAHDETLRAMAAAIYSTVFFDDVSLSFDRAERRRTSEYRRAVGAAQQAMAAASRVRERERRQLPLL